MNKIELKVGYIKAANYALIHNRIPVCQNLEIHNISGVVLHDLQLICEGEYIAPYESAIVTTVKQEETVRVTEFEIVPVAAKLLELTERVNTSFKITVIASGEIICEEEYELALMPFDQWLGTSILPQTLVSFITPNHPAISSLILKAAAKLKDLSGSSSFHAYQAGNSNDVRMQVAAIYAALHDEGIVYRGLPASYEAVGQRITLPDQVLATKLGNCIELTLLFASVLESVGINCGIIIQKGHAYLAVWLVDDCCAYGICDDASFIEKKCSRGIDEMIVLECTQVAQEKTSFEKAVTIAEQHLADHSQFEMLIDVLRCRLERFLPLPTRVLRDGTWTVEQGVEHDQCVLDVKEHDRYDLSHLRESSKELTKFDIWERKLLDFSLRNSLLNLYLRRKAIQFISFDVDKIEDHLQDGEEYCILAKPDVEFHFENAERMNRSKLAEPLRELITTDIAHHRLHTYQTEAETQGTLKNIYRAARNAIEETGANSLFLTIGTLRWYETPLSETPRYAPLLLLPVEMVYKKGSYFIRTREEEITLNITLIEFLRQNYDIRINGLDPLPKDQSGVDVPLIFAIIRDALKEQKRWDVEEECLLGTFSFSKFLMWNDVHNNREQLKKNDIVNSLVENRLTFSPEALTSDLRSVDAEISPSELALPVAVDSSQMAAVIEGGKGHSFILYGPPGTGKSQTITNLIANALYQGKRVLFVAEKMAALSVVQSRLAKIGLDPFCLELHSNKVTKRHVLEQLESALKVTHIVPPSDYAATADKVFARRKELIEYMKALHDVDPQDGLSLYDCILRYESVDAEPLAGFSPDPALDALISREGVKAVEEKLGSRFETVIKLVGQPSQHPLKGMHVTKEMLMSPDETVSRMKESVQVLQDTEARREELQKTKSMREHLLRNNDVSLFSADARGLYDEWRAAKSKWFIPKYFAKKSFVKKLKQYNQYITGDEVDGMLDELLTYNQLHQEIGRQQKVLRDYFGIAYGEDDLPKKDTVMNAVSSMERWIASAPKMREWIHWSEYSDELKAAGMSCVLSAMEAREYAPDTMRRAYMKALFRQKAESKISSSAMLVSFEGMIFDDKVKAYKDLTEEFQLLTQKELYARLAAKVPRVTENIDSSSEIGLLNRNISNGGRGLSLRDLFDQIPTLMPRLCPCMLMSPMSVAQYLDLTQEKFDLVVFDEASQMPTSEAVGAIARGKSLIVVGDPKQMPPTSFFSSTTVDEEEAAIDDMESILEDCRTLEIPSLQLNWHYRSKHESLIAFSNHEYYDGSLITFPSVDDQSTKVQYIPVSGYYDKGGKRSNAAEAEAIVQEIARRLKEGGKKSLGVIAFSVVQQSLIEDMLQDLLDKDKEIREAADALYEPIFVKNLENVQGDERDVILFSIGYGPDKDGKVSMNFGPLNNAGGERRLNVAVSRARYEMLVFSTLKASQIDLRRSKARGVEGLKHFLEYAETQALATSSTAVAQHRDSQLSEQIAVALTARGYLVKTNIGRSQFKVDIAICDPSAPDVYQLGILLDGESYRDTQTTRDREIVQPSVLGALNWRVMRVWSVDWYNNQQRVLDRIAEVLNTAPAKPVESPIMKVFDIQSEKIETVETAAEEYKSYSVSIAYAKRLSDKELMKKIVTTEQPVSFMELCRRVCALREIPRVTPTIQNDFGQYLGTDFYAEPDRDGQVVWLTEEDSRNYKSYRPDSGRDISDIPMTEIKNVVREAIAEQFALQTDNLTLIAAKKLGFTRRGNKVDAAFREALDQLKAAGEIDEVDGKLSIRS